MKKIINISLILIIHLSAASTVFISSSDQLSHEVIQKFSYECKKSNTYQYYYPKSLSSIYKQASYILESQKKYSLKCIDSANALIKLIEDKISQKEEKVGLQTSYNNFYFQDADKRFYQASNIYFSSEGINKNLHYKIKVQKNKSGGYILDESQLNFLIKNTIVSFGKIPLWWSSSQDTSLIYSNSARPQTGISISNNSSIIFNGFIGNLIGPFDFSIFLNKLEENRHISNALLFGNRFSFMPHERLNISLLRVAQFGGDGRPTDSDTIIKMILGKDTTNSEMGFDEQPGNQIAGIDVSLSLLEHKNLRFYFQYLGEDGLDPIIDDRWIGAIFPSKRFEHIGLDYSFYFKDQPISVAIDLVDTFSGYPNVTYNHGLYMTGYRYKNKPIGANIDADSDKKSLTFKAKINEQTLLKLKFIKSEINKNNSQYNSLSKDFFSAEEVNLVITKYFKNLSFSAVYLKRNSSEKLFDSHDFFIRMEYKL